MLCRMKCRPRSEAAFSSRLHGCMSCQRWSKCPFHHAWIKTSCKACEYYSVMTQSRKGYRQLHEVFEIDILVMKPKITDSRYAECKAWGCNATAASASSPWSHPSFACTGRVQQWHCKGSSDISTGKPVFLVSALLHFHSKTQSIAHTLWIRRYILDKSPCKAQRVPAKLSGLSDDTVSFTVF